MFQMPKMQFYQHLQFRHALSPSLVDLESLPEFSPLEAKVFMGDLGTKNIKFTNPLLHILPLHSRNCGDSGRGTWVHLKRKTGGRP